MSAALLGVILGLFSPEVRARQMVCHVYGSHLVVERYLQPAIPVDKACDCMDLTIPALGPPVLALPAHGV